MIRNPEFLTTRTKFFIVGFLYFSEGLPFGFINNLLSVYFRVKGISLEEIGFLSLLGLAWSFKILWAPLVDRFGRRFWWVFPAQIAVGFFTALLAFLDPVSTKALFWLALAGICLSSATQDIAADAYTIDILDEKELGTANGIRSALYRVALITSGGVLVMLSDPLGWSLTFIASAVMMICLALVVLALPQFHCPRLKFSDPLPITKQYWEPIKLLFERPNFLTAVFFVILFKVGEAMLVAMANPFWIDRGFTPARIGFVVGTLGTLASIAGAVSGGILTARWGILRALWILGAVQAAASLGYFFSSLPAAPLYSIYFAAILESLAIGLATAAFLSFLMKLCDKRFSATHYAFLTVLFGLGRSLAGVAAGYSAPAMGYALFFLLTFFIGLAPLPLLLFMKSIFSPKGTGNPSN
ncbi:MAG TPA: MFS transporter [Thermodesulfobacteriota bacterium]|nr:MFS transporter [Thermodesulfobacteriota bacterium]